MAKQARVPPLNRPHKWILYGTFELKLGEHETGRIVGDPEDVAVPWRERAKLVSVKGPGCEECGVHASEGMGTSCRGKAGLRELQNALAEQAERQASKIWTPGSDPA